MSFGNGKPARDKVEGVGVARNSVSKLRQSITDQDQAQQGAYLALLFSCNEEVVWSIGHDHVLLDFNPEFCKAMLASYDVIISPGMRIDELFPASCLTVWSALIEVAMLIGLFRGEFLLRDGRILDLTLRPVITDKGLMSISISGQLRDRQDDSDIASTDVGKHSRLSAVRSVGLAGGESGNEAGTKRSLKITSAEEQVQRRDELVHAIVGHELELYYQPQVDRGRIVGAEALIRWNHPKRGLVSPAEFIPFAEETGLILDLGKWVLDDACARLAEWSNHEILRHLTVSINVSAKQAIQLDFVSIVRDSVSRFGINPTKLELELTENVFISNFEDLISKMTALKSFGVRFAVDDFGTGYSSLSYLKRLPLDQLKIDQSFIRDLLVDVNSGSIVQAMISLGQAMGLKVIAEGVEKQEQCKFLRAMGCRSYQGYLIGHPVSSTAFEQSLSELAERSADF